MKKVLALLLTMAMTVTTLVGCGGATEPAAEEAAVETEAAAEGEEAAEEAAPALDMSETVKMGVLVSDATTAESLVCRGKWCECVNLYLQWRHVYAVRIRTWRVSNIQSSGV